MAAPGVYARGTPAGAAIERGFKCKFTLGLLPTFSMWEFEITPGKISGGPPISHTTFFNKLFHTQLPQALIKNDPYTIKGKYDSDVFKGTTTDASARVAPASTNQLLSLVNVNGACTFLLPNLGTLSHFGWVREVDFSTFKEGDTTPPTITLMVEISNWDPVNRVEAGWAYADGYTGTADS